MKKDKKYLILHTPKDQLQTHSIMDENSLIEFYKLYPKTINEIYELGKKVELKTEIKVVPETTYRGAEVDDPDGVGNYRG